MDSTALIVIVVAVVVLGMVLLTLVRSARVLTPDARPADWADTVAAQLWDEKAAGARDEFGLPAIRATARTWGASIAGLLGVLGTVAFVVGPTNLVEDVGGTEAEVAAWLILGAASLTAVATTLAILAEQGTPEWQDNLDGWALRSLTEKRAHSAEAQLRASRYLVLVALLLILLATAIAWMTSLTGEEPETEQEAIVVTADGARCGVLSTEDGNLSLEVGPAGPEAIGTVATITPSTIAHDGCVRDHDDVEASIRELPNGPHTETPLGQEGASAAGALGARPTDLLATPPPRPSHRVHAPMRASRNVMRIVAPSPSGISSPLMSDTSMVFMATYASSPSNTLTASELRRTRSDPCKAQHGRAAKRRQPEARLWTHCGISRIWLQRSSRRPNSSPNILFS